MLGQTAEPAAQKAAGLLPDPSGNLWDVVRHKGNVYPKFDKDAGFVDWKSRDGARVSFPRGVEMDAPVATETYFHVGLLDTRTNTLKAKGAFQLTVGTDGRLTPEAGASFQKLMGEGGGQMAYHFFLPCATMRRDGEVGPKENDWVREIVLGAQVRGVVNFHNFGPELVYNAGAALDGDINEDGVRVGGSVGACSHSSGKFLVNNMVQEGGVHLVTQKYESQNLVELYRYLQDKWAKETRKRSDTWQPLMIKVEQKVEIRNLESSPHAIVVGRSGVGKSSFLNTIAGGVRDSAGELIFRTGKRAGSVTTEVHSEVHRLDVFTHDRQSKMGVEVKRPFRLTDVPGFGATDLRDDEIMANLLLHLAQPDWKTFHAIVWVERFDKCRFTDDDRRQLQTLEQQFGRKLWDKLVVVFTNFKFGDPAQNPEMDKAGDDADIADAQSDFDDLDKFGKDTAEKNPGKARRIAEALKQWRAKQFLSKLKALHPNAAERYGESRNMFFLVDNADAQLTDKRLGKMKEEEKKKTDDDPTKGEFYRRKEGREFARDQVRLLKTAILTSVTEEDERKSPPLSQRSSTCPSPSRFGSEDGSDSDS